MRLMPRRIAIGTLLLCGCGLVQRSPLRRDNQLPPPPPITSSQYHLDGWDWASVARVLILPVRNESQYTNADEEFGRALAAEFQRLGRFEIVTGPPDDVARLAEIIHVGGRFDERTMLELGRKTSADVVVHATLTQYSPYPRPRLGTVIQVVSPRDAKVVASIDGLWDMTDGGLAEEIRTYYRQRPKPLPTYVRNHAIVADDNFASDLALDSPQLFQRYVAHVAATTLTGRGDADVVVGPIVTNSAMSGSPCAPPPRGILHRILKR